MNAKCRNNSLMGGMRTLINLTDGLAADMASNLGAIALHGPHHVAKKSTTMGVPDLMSSCSSA